jgi:hypothetical protein
LRKNTGETSDIEFGQGATENYGHEVRELFSKTVIGASSPVHRHEEDNAHDFQHGLRPSIHKEVDLKNPKALHEAIQAEAI